VSAESRRERLRARIGRDVDPGVTLQPEPAADQSGTWDELLLRLRSHGAVESRYRPQGEVARGGMGAVLRVWDQELRRTVAKKVLIERDDDQLGGPVVERRIGRFLEEAQISAQLEHPGIVPIHELGLDASGRLYFTMQLVHGRDLKAIWRVVREGAEGWNQTRALSVLLRVCEAMAFAHSKGVVHRDLKPANVMVGRFGEVYVMDWGLARVLGRPGAAGAPGKTGATGATDDGSRVEIDGPATTIAEIGGVTTERRPEGVPLQAAPMLTMEGDVLGTPTYMAPEQARGALSEIGPAADVYSVGAMLYELLAGVAPYHEPGTPATPRDVWRRVVAGPPSALGPLARRQPAELVAICERAMAREPARRYADMQALASDLRAFLENRVVRAHRTGAAVELAKWVRRNRGMAAALAALLLVAVGAGFVVAAKERSRLEAQSERVATALLAEAEQGWPIEPASVPAMARWLESARAVGARRDATLAELEALRRRLGAWIDPAVVTSAREQLDLALAARTFWQDWVEKDRADVAAGTLALVPTDEPELLREIERLDKRIADLHAAPVALETWVAADPRDQAELDWLQARGEAFEALGHPQTGRTRQVEGWIAAAKDLPERSIEAHRADWDRALAAIGAADSPYHGLQLTPQIGLVPLGPDPASGLWEFWHVLSGERPERDASGRLHIGDDTGIVLVLIPGANFMLGAQSEDPKGLNFDALAVGADGPVKPVQLDPYFLSKYELTQGQWLRATGDNPSIMPAPSSVAAAPERVTLAYPVQQVSWTDAERVLHNWALELPTEAQWEYAARGGTSTVYWWGDRWDDRDGAVNFADTLWQRGNSLAVDDTLGADGYSLFAPVDSLRPNPFGLHHVLGDVAEWCRDWYGIYRDTDTESGDGARRTPLTSTGRPIRGGSSRDDAAALRCAARSHEPPDVVSSHLGLRPSRSISHATNWP
jgi:formylglycine-generating enzyme required for sulfatase activity/serine/threonine protein kinase